MYEFAQNYTFNIIINVRTNIREVSNTVLINNHFIFSIFKTIRQIESIFVKKIEIDLFVNF